MRQPVPGQLCLLQLLEQVASAGPRHPVGAVGAISSVAPIGSGRADGVGSGEGAGLGEWERAVLRFAADHHLTGRYASRVERQLGCSSDRYLQTLAGMLDRDEALAAAPELVATLRALRDRRRALRERARHR